MKNMLSALVDATAGPSSVIDPDKPVVQQPAAGSKSTLAPETALPPQPAPRLCLPETPGRSPLTVAAPDRYQYPDAANRGQGKAEAGEDGYTQVLGIARHRDHDGRPDNEGGGDHTDG